MNGKHILVIDDDLAFAEMFKEILEAEGVTVTLAHDGVEGLEAANQLHPDLIMCDGMMPRKTGMEVLAGVRESDWGASVPFMLLTNMSQPEAFATLDPVKKVNTECLLKTDWTLDDLAQKLKTVLAGNA